MLVLVRREEGWDMLTPLLLPPRSLLLLLPRSLLLLLLEVKLRVEERAWLDGSAACPPLTGQPTHHPQQQQQQEGAVHICP